MQAAGEFIVSSVSMGIWLSSSHKHRSCVVTVDKERRYKPDSSVGNPGFLLNSDAFCSLIADEGSRWLWINRWGNGYRYLCNGHHRQPVCDWFTGRCTLPLLDKMLSRKVEGIASIYVCRDVIVALLQPLSQQPNPSLHQTIIIQWVSKSKGDAIYSRDPQLYFEIWSIV